MAQEPCLPTPHPPSPTQGSLKTFYSFEQVFTLFSFFSLTNRKCVVFCRCVEISSPTDSLALLVCLIKAKLIIMPNQKVIRVDSLFLTISQTFPIYGPSQIYIRLFIEKRCLFINLITVAFYGYDASRWHSIVAIPQQMWVSAADMIKGQDVLSIGLVVTVVGHIRVMQTGSFPYHSAKNSHFYIED